MNSKLFIPEKIKVMTFENFEDLIDIVPEEVSGILNQLKNIKDNPIYHPEPNVFTHIKIVVERLLLTEDIDMVLLGLFHDLGKLEMFRINEKTNYPQFPGHEKVSCEIIERNKNFIESLGGDYDVVYEIVKEHMRIKKIGEMRRGKKNKLLEHPYYDKIVLFNKADSMLDEFIYDKNLM